MYEPGQKIKFALPDKDAKLHWFDGVIHAVRRYEDSATNLVKKVTYLIDTGRDVHSDTHVRNKRRDFIAKEGRKIQRGIENLSLDKRLKAHSQAIDKIMASPDLPPDEDYEVLVRQPEQIELTPDFVKPRDE